MSFALRLSLCCVAVLGALVVFTPSQARPETKSKTAVLLAKPVSLPDMALGRSNAPIIIVEYSSLSCPHCAAFEENVFPMLQSKYIDSGKVRFVSREFPLDDKAAAASMVARCIASNDAPRYFDVINMMFKQQDALLDHTTETLKDIGSHFGMNDQAIETCVKDQALLDKISADQKFAYDHLKVDATPTFFINGEMHKGSMSFEELDSQLAKLLRR